MIYKFPSTQSLIIIYFKATIGINMNAETLLEFQDTYNITKIHTVLPRYIQYYQDTYNITKIHVIETLMCL